MQNSPPPASIAEFDEHLFRLSEGLPKRLRQCASYVAENKERIAVSTVVDMARGAGVHTSAFVRFCQLLGFSGFTEMQKLFRTSFAGSWPDYSTRLDSLREKGEGSAAALLPEFAEASRTSLDMLLKSVDADVLNRVADALAKANVIHIIGSRRSFPISSYLAYALEKMNVAAMLHSGVGYITSPSSIRPGDVLLAITFTPYAAETMALIEEVSSRGIPVVAITDNIVSPVMKFDATTLFVSEVDFGAFRSLSATLCVAMALSVAVGTARQRK
jgi:DNA-binding MurR/RpiR family transcriptional regulator